jgi:hypothetical protein
MDALLPLRSYRNGQKEKEWYDYFASALLAVFALGVFFTGLRNFM